MSHSGTGATGCYINLDLEMGCHIKPDLEMEIDVDEKYNWETYGTPFVQLQLARTTQSGSSHKQQQSEVG